MRDLAWLGFISLTNGLPSPVAPRVRKVAALTRFCWLDTARVIVCEEYACAVRFLDQAKTAPVFRQARVSIDKVVDGNIENGCNRLDVIHREPDITVGSATVSAALADKAWRNRYGYPGRHETWRSTYSRTASAEFGNTSHRVGSSRSASRTGWRAISSPTASLIVSGNFAGCAVARQIIGHS
jgi:hypothetical protein